MNEFPLRAQFLAVVLLSVVLVTALFLMGETMYSTQYSQFAPEGLDIITGELK
jgi:hypothetical protein